MSAADELFLSQMLESPQIRDRTRSGAITRFRGKNEPLRPLGMLAQDDPHGKKRTFLGSPRLAAGALVSS
jgi:hypothetical protein